MNPSLSHGVLLLWEKTCPNVFAFSPGQPPADGLENHRRGFPRPLPPPVLCPAFPGVGLGWVPGKGKKKLAGLVWGGEQAVHSWLLELVTVLGFPCRKLFHHVAGWRL